MLLGSFSALELAGSRLRSIQLSRCRPELTDEAVQHLSAISTLQSVDLDHCGLVTDAGVRFLSKLPRLRRLCLVNTKVTSDGVASLYSARTLQYLRLGRGVQLSDGHLQWLKHRMIRVRTADRLVFRAD